MGWRRRRRRGEGPQAPLMLSAGVGGSSDQGGGGNINATLHSCKALVQYCPEDEYCEDKMQPYPWPYPLDRLLAVRAGMGTGRCVILGGASRGLLPNSSQ
jgi:hypothetical protein